MDLRDVYRIREMPVVTLPMMLEGKLDRPEDTRVRFVSQVERDIEILGALLDQMRARMEALYAERDQAIVCVSPHHDHIEK